MSELSEDLRPLEVVESNDPLVVPRRVALLHPDIRPAVRGREERWVMTFPHLIVREVILIQVVVVGLALAALFFDAPLESIANPLETPNPAKAPWYFLGLQELLHYFPPVVAGVLLPALVVIALIVIPYARINLEAVPLWAKPSRTKTAALATAVIGLTALFAAFRCWPIVVPTVAVGAAMALARRARDHGWRRWLWSVTLP